jgi:perosamine synthetase
MNEATDITNYWMSSIITPSPKYRNKLREYLKNKKIDTRPFFYPITMFGLYKDKKTEPISKEIGLRGINLPSRVDLTSEEIKYVIKNIKDFHEKYKG